MKTYPSIKNAEAVAEQARQHHARLHALLSNAQSSSGNLPLMKQRLTDLLPCIASNSRIDSRSNYLGAVPLDESGYAGHLSVAIGNLINTDCGEHYPEIWRQLLTAYFEAGYFDVDEFDAFVHPIPKACTMLEKAMRVGSGTAAATFIELGADIGRVPHETYMEMDMVTGERNIEIKAGDFDALVAYLRTKCPGAMNEVMSALMRRTLASAAAADPAQNTPATPAANRRRAQL